MSRAKKKRVGRPKLAADERKGNHIGLRIDDDLLERVDAQLVVEEAAKPGLVVSRSMMLRILVVEALMAREQVKKRR